MLSTLLLLGLVVSPATGLSGRGVPPPKQPIVVSAPTGRVGSAVVRSLVSTLGSGADIFVLARDADKAKRMFGENKEEEGCVRILTASYDDEEALTAAFAQVPKDRGGFRLFLACGNGPNQEALESGVLRAACRSDACCSRVVKLSTATAVLEEERGGPHAAHVRLFSSPGQ